MKSQYNQGLGALKQILGMTKASQRPRSTGSQHEVNLAGGFDTQQL